MLQEENSSRKIWRAASDKSRSRQVHSMRSERATLRKASIYKAYVLWGRGLFVTSVAVPDFS